MLSAPRDFLTSNQVFALIRKQRRTGDRSAQDQVVRAHIGLVFKIARQYRWARHDLDDLVQVGCMGLLRAMEKFDPRRGVMLSTYAVPWIRAMIVHFILENWRLVRVGTTEEQRRAFFGARRNGGLVTKDDVLQQHMTTPELSLDAPMGGGEFPVTRLMRLPAPESARPDVQAESHEARARFRAVVSQFVAGLEGRDRLVFEARWLAPDPRSLASVGEELGVSKERTRQLEERILGRLEKFLRKRIEDVQSLAPALAAAA